MRSAIRKIFVPREKILCRRCKIFPFARLCIETLKRVTLAQPLQPIVSNTIKSALATFI